MVAWKNNGSGKIQIFQIFIYSFKWTNFFYFRYSHQVGFFPKEYVREYPQPSEELWCYNYMVIFTKEKSSPNDSNNNAYSMSPTTSTSQSSFGANNLTPPTPQPLPTTSNSTLFNRHGGLFLPNQNRISQSTQQK